MYASQGAWWRCASAVWPEPSRIGASEFATRAALPDAVLERFPDTDFADSVCEIGHQRTSAKTCASTSRATSYCPTTLKSLTPEPTVPRRCSTLSHGSVASEATVALTTRMFEEAAKGATKAEALRRSMMALMTTPGKPLYAHPAFWAPFVVVGEGALRRNSQRLVSLVSDECPPAVTQIGEMVGECVAGAGKWGGPMKNGVLRHSIAPFRKTLNKPLNRGPSNDSGESNQDVAKATFVSYRLIQCFLRRANT